jgi:Na+-transporting NADH:ubiquinone oxidoreductase subunit NqrC
MKRMGNVLLTVLVLVLTCSLIIAAGSSTAKTTSKSGKKLIKMWVDKANGQILKVKHVKDDGSEGDAIPVSPPQSAQYIGTILYTHSSPGCVYYVIGGTALKVCW